MLSKKTNGHSHGQDSSYFYGWQEYLKNPYHHAHSPTGIIQMGLAENQLSFDLLEEWLASNPDALGLKKNGESLFKELALFQDYHGLPAFKKELVKYMAKIRGEKVTFDDDKLVLTAGATSANEILIFCLADPGEAFLLPTPYYPAFDRDLKWRTGVEIVPIHCRSSNGFRVTPSAMEKAYREARRLKLKVKGVLITDPSNPLGRTMSREELHDLIDFAMAKEIHIVSDEVYAGTAFDSPGFLGVRRAAMEKNLQGTAMWRRIHIVSSLSKDLGLPGFRVGFVYTDNQTVQMAATKMSSFGLVSSQTQHLFSNMLSDQHFISRYVEQNRNRIRQRKEKLVSGLRTAGIECLEGNSGLFSWVDMRKLLGTQTFEAEKELWKRILSEVGLNISPGSSCHCSEPGWFRMCFADMSEETLMAAVQRLKCFVDSSCRSGEEAASRRRPLTEWVLKLAGRRQATQR